MLSRIAEKYTPALLVGGIVFSAAVIGIYSRHFGQLAQIWPANALLLWMMITYRQLDRWSGWLGACIGYLLAGWIMKDRFVVNAWLASANLAGVCAGYLLFRVFRKRGNGLEGPKSVLSLLLVCSGAAGPPHLSEHFLQYPFPGRRHGAALFCGSAVN